jgi:hypothetical protein
MELLRQHVIAPGKAAKLLQFDRWELSERMGPYTVLAIDRTPEELQDKLITGRQLRSTV